MPLSDAVVEVHAVPTLASAPERWRGDELLDEDATIGLDHPLRSDVVGRSRDLDVTEALGLRFSQHFAEGAGGIATPLFPRHDRVADMPKAVRWERLCPALPT